MFGEHDLLDTMGFDEYLIDNTEASFVITMKGDSMLGAGILDGDLLLVERGKTPKPNDIIIAEKEGEYKVRYYKVHEEKAFVVEAVVAAVIRKY